MTTDHLQIELNGLRAQFTELQRWSQAAAEELQDLINSAEEAGCHDTLPTCQKLLDEHSAIMQRFFGVKNSPHTKAGD